jgi:hypothetical protein
VSTDNEVQEKHRTSLGERLFIQNRRAALLTLSSIVVGVAAFVLLSMMPRPYLVVDLFRFGLWPAAAVITTVGSLRGPLAGLLTGYLGTLLYGLLVFATIVSMSLDAVALGVMGFVVGLVRYDFSSGRSIAKLSIVSAIGMLIAAVITLAVGLAVEVYADLVAIGFVLLPLLTVGLPSVFLLTPLFGWLVLSVNARIPASTAK